MKMIYEMQLFLLNLQNFMYYADSEKISRLDTYIRESPDIVLVTHLHPDGDAVGSVTAMWEFLDKCRGRNASILVPDEVPPTLEFLAGQYDILNGGDEEAFRRIAGADLIIALDLNALRRADILAEALGASKARKVLIDHHPDPCKEEFDLVFSRTDVSSACEMLFHVLSGMPGTSSGAALPQGCAYSLMTGMTTDTNNFANSVFPGTFAMASTLISSGVDRDSIIQHIYNSGRKEKIKAWSYLLDRKLIMTDFGAAYIFLDRETRNKLGLLDGETDGLVNIPLQAADIRLSALLTEEEDHIRVSLRSKKGVSANDLARNHFHGGGHVLASGGRILVPGDIMDSSTADVYFKETAARFLRDAEDTAKE